MAEVRRDSPAWQAGLRAGDRLRSLGGRPVASFADVQYALHRAPPKGKVALTWSRAGSAHEGEPVLGEGWRRTDLSWRWSLRGVDPPPWVHGEDLTEAEKKALAEAPRRETLVRVFVRAYRLAGFLLRVVFAEATRRGSPLVPRYDAMLDALTKITMSALAYPATRRNTRGQRAAISAAWRRASAPTKAAICAALPAACATGPNCTRSPSASHAVAPRTLCTMLP